MCPGIHPFLLDFLVYLCRGVYSGSLYFCGISGDTPFTIFYFVYLILFFSISLANGTSTLLIFYKKQLLDSLIFFFFF